MDIYKQLDFIPCPYILAGGSVRDHLMGREPKDYDFFLLNPSDEDVTSISLSISQKFTPISNNFHLYEPFLIESFYIGNKIVQLMKSPYSSMEALVNSFDWNVSLFAYDGNDYLQLTDLKDIVFGGDLKLNKLTYPKATLRRGYRFSERFGMNISDSDLELIIKSIKFQQKFEEGEGI